MFSLIDFKRYAFGTVGFRTIYYYYILRSATIVIYSVKHFVFGSEAFKWFPLGAVGFKLTK